VEEASLGQEEYGFFYRLVVGRRAIPVPGAGRFTCRVTQDLRSGHDQPARGKQPVCDSAVRVLRLVIRWHMRVAFRMLVDLVASPYGATVIVFLMALLASFVLSPNSPLEHVIGAPVFGLPILAGVFLGYLVNKKRFSWTAIFAWLIPAVVFLIAYRELTQPQNLNPHPWRNLVGADCSSSECLYEVFATTPLICGLAYSATALTLYLRNRRIVGVSSGH
jgi:hypothetical protein